jgi:hypothetical protein
MVTSKHCISSILLAALLMAAPWALAAAQQAVVVKVQGSAQLSISDGKPHGVQIGEVIPAGATLKTGPGAILGIVLSDGSRLWLRENTELTLADASLHGKARSTLMDLAWGAVRLLVNKLHSGDRFEVRTHNAVAAVKGTDWELGYDPKADSSQVQVYATDGLGVLLSDLAGKVQTLVAAGQSAIADGDGPGDAQALTAEELAAAKAELEALLSQVQGMQGSGQEPGLSELSDEIQSLLTEVETSQRVEGGAAAASRHDDAVQSLVTYDRFGYQALLAHRVDRPSANTVVQTHVTDHLGGPDAGIDTLVESVSFNTALPSNWVPIMRATENLATSTYLDSTNYPSYYRVRQGWTASNPQGESIAMDTVYEAPFFTSWMVVNDHDIIDPSTLGQGYYRTYTFNWVNGDGPGSFQTQECFGAFLSGNIYSYQTSYCPTMDEATGRSAPISSLIDYISSGSAPQSYSNAQGGMTTDYTYYPTGSTPPSTYTLFSINYNVLNESGLTGAGPVAVPVVPIFGYSVTHPTLASKASSLPTSLQPSQDLIHGLSTAPGVLDVTFSSSMLSHEIDLLFEGDSFQSTFNWSSPWPWDPYQNPLVQYSWTL